MEIFSVPPGSTLMTVVLALTISLVTTLINRRFVDRTKTAVWQAEIRKWMADREKARKTGDKKLLAKVEKQQPRIMQIQSQMLSQNMRPLLINFIPILVLWQIFMYIFNFETVAFIPLFPNQEIFSMPFFYWYLICSFFVSTILQRIFGIHPDLQVKK